MARAFRCFFFRKKLLFLLVGLASVSLSFSQNTIFQPTEVPATLLVNDGQGGVEVGTKFRVTGGGNIIALRFYKGAGNTGTHSGHLWSSSGTLLASATFTGETASGWQEASLVTPVAIVPNTTYIVSYFSPNGYYSNTNPYFTSAVVNGPLRGLAWGEDGPNGIFTFSGSPVFPVDNYQASNYWADVVFVIPDVTPPTISSVSPLNGTMNVSAGTSVSAVFNEPVNASTINSTNFQLRNASGTLVPGTVSYTSATLTATFTPSASLINSTTYTATIKGGASGVKDTAANALAADYSWSFTTVPPVPANGQGGPILVISSTTNPFSRYAVEILRAEGLNEFAAVDISSITAGVLNNYEVVILGEMTVTAGQVTLLTSWVNAGGTLIAFRPDATLNSLMGLSAATGTLSDKYLLVKANSGPGPGVGIVNQTIQFHGTADIHTMTSGATALATLYSAAATATTNPAVTTRNVGSNGGRAIAFTYDLAKSIIYTRQGNPAWAGIKHDGTTGPVRSDDMFFGLPANTGVDWVDFSKIAIPQADEQQRLLANIILQGNLHHKPLPRLWYLPRGLKAAIVMTGDDHGLNGTVGRFNDYLTKGPNTAQDVTNWTAIRGTSYIYTGTPITDAQATAFEAQGFEIALHANTNCTDFTLSSLTNDFTTQLANLATSLPGISAPVTNRTHCLPWSDWASQAKAEATKGIRLDVNYYYWPAAWVQNRPGMFTGSGMPMRFADTDGSLIDCYQATTQMTDESGADLANFTNQLLDKAIGPEGYYGVFTTNMHTDTAIHTGSNIIIASAQARQIPVISAKQMLTWLDGRNNSFFGTIMWDNNQLSFPITAYSGANNLQAMVPFYSKNGQLTSITKNGVALSFTTQLIKGMQYGFFDVAMGINDYTATYTLDTLPPVITNIVAVPHFNGSATVTWNTNEGTDSKINYSTDSAILNLNEGDNNITTSHSLTVTGLTPGTTYYYRLSGTDVANNSTSMPGSASTPLSFTVPFVPCVYDQTSADFNFGTTGTNTVVASEGDGTVILKPAVKEEFSGNALPSGWTSDVYAVGGTTIIAGGNVTLNGAHVYSNNTYGPGSAIEFVAAFTTASFQNIGFASNQPFTSTPWATVGEASPDGNIYARTSDGASVSLGSNLLGSSHRYSIKWNAGNFEFYVDGSITPAATINFVVTDPMYVQVSDFANNDGTLIVDWLRVLPYVTSGTYTSQVIDAGSARPWGSVIWNKDTPAGTDIAVSVRTGDTPVPDGTWAAYSTVTSGTTIGKTARYIQYKADFTTTDIKLTATLKDILISCSAPVIIKQPSSKTICEGSVVNFTSVATGVPLPKAQWQVSTDGTTWSDISGAVDSVLSFTVVAADNNKQYRASWTNSDGTINSAPAVLNTNAIPVAPTVTVVNTCGNSELTASNYTGALLWSNNATVPSITVTDALTYTVTQTETNGCTSIAGSGVSAPKIIPAAPTVTVVDNCGSSLLTAGNYTGSLLWSNEASASSITVSVAGTYMVAQTGANGCTSTNGVGEAVPKTVPSAPSVGVVNNCGNAVLTAGNYTGTLLWSNGATASSITVTNAQTYTVRQTTANGCTSGAGSETSAPKTIPATPAVTVVNNCGSSLLSTTAPGSLLWSNGATTASTSVSAPGIYTVTQTAANGCISSNGSGVAAPKRISPPPSITAKGPVTFCQGGSVTLVSSTKMGNLWSNGATTQSIVVNTSGTYTVVFIGENGCASGNSNQVTVTVNPVPSAPSVAVANNCGSSVLTASNYSGTLLWSNGQTTPSITVTNAGSYNVRQTVNGCTSAAVSGSAIPKSIPSAPVITAVGPTTFCAGGSVLLTSSAVTGNTWSTGATTQSITVTTPGSRTVNYVAANGCTSPASAPITVTVKATSSSTINVTICSAQLPYVWNNNNYFETGTYTVTGFTNAAGCDSTATLNLLVNINPVLSSSLIATATHNILFTYTPMSTTQGTIFNWVRTAITGVSNIAATGSGTIAEALILDNPGGSAINVRYIYTLTANGCSNDDTVIITVNPPPLPKNMPVTTTIKHQVTSTDKSVISTIKLDATTIPNPTTTYFNLVIKGNSETPVTVRILDIFGRVIEYHEKIASVVALSIGHGWAAGTYYAEVIQGNQRKIVKMIKTN